MTITYRFVLILQIEATMFSLAKYAYLACNLEQRALYDNAPGYTPPIDISSCCIRLLQYRGSETARRTFECEEAARLGHIDCLRAARQFGYQIDKWALMYALLEGQTECVDYILQDGYQESGWVITYTAAVRGGHIECLRTLRRHGVPWDGCELYQAILEKRPNCLRFLLENGCLDAFPDISDGVTCQTNVECIKLLREFGMPWNNTFLIHAHNSGNYELIKYAVENGCPNPDNRPSRRSARLLERRRFLPRSSIL